MSDTNDRELPAEGVPPFDGTRDADVGPERSGVAGIAISWLVVLAVGALILLLANAAEPPSTSGPDVLLELEAKSVIGISMLPGSTPAMVRDQLAVRRDRGSVPQRVATMILFTEVGDLESARQELESLDAAIEDHHARGKALEPDEARLWKAARDLYSEGVPAEKVRSLPEEDREVLRETLGWVGSLALAPDGAETPTDGPSRTELRLDAARVMGIFGTAASLLTILGLCGFFALAALSIAGSAGLTRRHFAPARLRTGRSIQTFALWIVFFFALQFLAGLMVEILGLTRGLSSLVAFFLSLLALLWPIFRGDESNAIRSDFGLHAGGGVLRELVVAGWGYCMMLPFLGAGMLGTIALSALVGSSESTGLQPVETPSHPIISELANTTPLDKWLLVAVAVIGAPVVEEIFFRGVLYRHFRQLSRPLGLLVSIVGSALATSFVFAVIHPQGLVAVPALMGIALGLTLLREWRDTLLPSMVVHGLWNGTLMAVLLGISG
ncbi:MAG: CPBP family intramembrane metalloprotease [Planctomycetes bacterium]|nr:CPBP family intramembrane metalloprotease [Planctomycetota bacterium]